jgi:hypothetical protein
MGLDFVGPFTPFGTADEGKVWILVVSCTLTRALILRVVQGLDVHTFRTTFNALCFDYNLHPHTIISDRAETFKAAFNRLVYANRRFLNNPKYRRNGPRLTWHFNASRAPWWGGFFERMMRMIKTKLAKLFIQNQQTHFPTLAAFQEAVAWTQLVLNSRPVSWAPTCGKYGQPVLALDLFLPRVPDMEDPFEVHVQDNWLQSATKAELENALTVKERWQSQVWNMFRDTYIAELRKRREEKEVKGRCSLLDEGQVILYKPNSLFKEHTPMGKLKWKMARIAKLHPGSDGRIRSVDLQFYDKKKDLWNLLKSQSIKHIAPFEVMLTHAEAQAHAVQNTFRRSERLKRKLMKDSPAQLEPPVKKPRYLLRRATDESDE